MSQESGDPFTHLPVEVHVAQLVGEPLHVVGLQSSGVVHDVVVRRRDTAGVDGLAHNVEVVPGGRGGSRQAQLAPRRPARTRTQTHSPLWSSDLGVDDGAGRRVGHLPAEEGEEPAADPLLHHHHAQFGPGREPSRDTGSNLSNPLPDLSRSRNLFRHPMLEKDYRQKIEIRKEQKPFSISAVKVSVK